MKFSDKCSYYVLVSDTGGIFCYVSSFAPNWPSLQIFMHTGNHISDLIFVLEQLAHKLYMKDVNSLP